MFFGGDGEHEIFRRTEIVEIVPFNCAEVGITFFSPTVGLQFKGVVAHDGLIVFLGGWIKFLSKEDSEDLHKRLNTLSVTVLMRIREKSFFLSSWRMWR